MNEFQSPSIDYASVSPLLQWVVVPLATTYLAGGKRE